MGTMQVFVLLLVVFLVGWYLGQRANKALMISEFRRLRTELKEQQKELQQPTTAPTKVETIKGAAAATTEAAKPETKEEINEELISILTAAVCAFLGKKARVRGARLLSNPRSLSLWAQQGRIAVQTSHSVRRR